MAGGKARHGVLFVSAGLAVGKGALQLTIEGPPPIFLSIGVRHPNQIQLDIAIREQVAMSGSG